MAMLNNQRVYTFRFLDTPSIYKNAVIYQLFGDVLWVLGESKYRYVYIYIWCSAAPEEPSIMVMLIYFVILDMFVFLMK